MHAAQPTEHRCHLFAREHDRHSRRRLRTLDVPEPRQVALEHVAVEEENRALCEILRRCCDLALNSEVRQECLDLRGPKRLRMPLAVEEDEAFNPVHVRLLGPDAVVPEPDLVAHAIEQARRLGDAAHAAIH